MGAVKVQILLVEDDEVDREAVCRLLGAPYDVVHAENGQAALWYLEDMQPDAVLLDYRLPDVDGMDLVPIFAKRFIPVIVLTGEDSPEIIVESIQRGAQDYLVKGHISHMSLSRAINNAIEKVELKRDLAEQQAKLAQQAIALERSNRQVRALASALTLAEQRERRRISQILHDHVQQMLYGIQMRTYLIGLDTPPEAIEKIREHLREMELLLNEAIQSTRTLTVELSPPVLKTEGLGAALSWLANQMSKVHDLEVELDIGDDYQLPSEDLRVLVFQLVRELLFNVVKHAQVNRARIVLKEVDNRYILRVEDQGIGFNFQAVTRSEEDNQGGFGLYSVRERLALFGGSLEVDSIPGAGTRVEIRLPKQAPSYTLGVLQGA